MFFSVLKKQLHNDKKFWGIVSLCSLMIVSIAYFIQFLGAVFPILSESTVLSRVFVTVYGIAYCIIAVFACIGVVLLIYNYHENWFSQEGLFYCDPPVRIHSALLASICNTLIWTVFLILVILSEILMTHIVSLSALRTVNDLTTAISTGFYSYESNLPIVMAVIFQILSTYFFFTILIMLTVTAASAIRIKFISLISVLGALAVLYGRSLLHNVIASTSYLSDPLLYAKYGVNSIQLYQSALDLLLAICGYFLIYYVLKKKTPCKVSK